MFREIVYELCIFFLKVLIVLAYSLGTQLHPNDSFWAGTLAFKDLALVFVLFLLLPLPFPNMLIPFSRQRFCLSRSVPQKTGTLPWDYGHEFKRESRFLWLLPEVHEEGNWLLKKFFYYVGKNVNLSKKAYCTLNFLKYETLIFKLLAIEFDC